MSIKIKDGDVLRAITAISIMDGGVLRRLQSLKVMHEGALRTVALFGSPVTATTSPKSVSATQSSPDPIEITAGPSTLTATGGVGPYSYTWTLTSGPTVVANQVNMAGSTFSGLVAPGTQISTLRCTVTDALGRTASDTVTVTLTNEYSGGAAP